MYSTTTFHSYNSNCGTSTNIEQFKKFKLYLIRSTRERSQLIRLGLQTNFGCGAITVLINEKLTDTLNVYTLLDAVISTLGKS